jgi:hypothetical protein
MLSLLWAMASSLKNRLHITYLSQLFNYGMCPKYRAYWLTRLSCVLKALIADGRDGTLAALTEIFRGLQQPLPAIAGLIPLIT